MNLIQCARSSLEQNLRMSQYNSNLYFVVTADISMGEELLVWYDQEQYNSYMGLPTGFREMPLPPLFLEQQQSPPQNTSGERSCLVVCIAFNSVASTWYYVECSVPACMHAPSCMQWWSGQVEMGWCTD